MPPTAQVLEIGAGSGAVGARLARDYAYTGVEADAGTAAIAQPRIEAAGGTLIVDDAATLRHPAVDLLCAFEVLEHIDDDIGAARSWLERLQPGGRLLISVPAQPHRMGPWDAAVGHHRRYDREGLRDVLRAAGFEDVEVWMVGFPLGYVLEVVRNRLAPTDGAPSLEERTAGSGRRLQPPARLAAVTRIVTAPFRWLQRPFEGSRLGTGMVATATRPLQGP